MVAAHPDYFVLGELQGQVSGQYRVRDRDGFIQGVLAILQGQGMCAFRIPESDTIQVKGSNDFSEEYELVSGRGFIHRGSLRASAPAPPPTSRWTWGSRWPASTSGSSASGASAG